MPGLHTACLRALYVLFCFCSVSVQSLQWLHKTSERDSLPWGNRNVAGSNPSRDAPVTGVTRYYDLHISRAVLAPDGVELSMIVINNQYPGPLLEANWGDWFEVTVYNEIHEPEEGTQMHWHGLNQQGTPYYDGVSAVSHCPIIPGNHLTYRFRADQYGTSWYHAHFSAQYTAGVVGPMVIYGPSHVEYDVDMPPIVVSDWYHVPYHQLVSQAVQTNVTDPSVTRPHAVSNLVNGLGVYPCENITNGTNCFGGSYSSFDFVPETRYRFRLVNTGSVAFEQISIDEHNMTVIANDFVPVIPYETSVVTLGVGQRTDVVVTATGKTNQSYWFRAWNHPLCGDNIQPDGRAIIFYPDSDRSIEPNGIGTIPPQNNGCQNDDLNLTTPMYSIPVSEPDLTLNLTMTYAPNATHSMQWLMNGIAYKGDLNTPLLLSAISNATTSVPSSRALYNLGTNTSIRLIFTNTFFAPHPMHQHGHNIQILAEGHGIWDGTITNPQNPQRRDVQMSWSAGTVSRPSYLVVQFELDNAGVWPFHCHVAWHLSAGMAVMFLERPDALVGTSVPSEVLGLCDVWRVWQEGHGTDVTDSARVVAAEEEEEEG